MSKRRSVIKEVHKRLGPLYINKKNLLLYVIALGIAYTEPDMPFVLHKV